MSENHLLSQSISSPLSHSSLVTFYVLEILSPHTTTPPDYH